MPSPRYWRQIPSRYRLEAGRCGNCGRVVYPKRTICPDCRGTEWEDLELSHHGKVVTATVVHVAPDDLTMEAPYVVAIVEVPEGPRMMAQIVDCDPASIVPGTEVELEFRKIRSESHHGILCYGYKGVPA